MLCQVAIGCAGLRALGYLLRHYVTNGEELPKHLLTPIVNVSIFIHYTVRQVIGTA